ncbi:phage/plasmid primase, P4 family [Streptomyces sp. NBC_01764]|uniref:DNA primase family protein n=1 Tax=Streptomyces sp. NBC_01764 TaxID=2975935 RepID=UPI002257F945|nr:phage/plasmid primase, P4 family [Streptomyces sp. NBC_01764]MCX4400819.1 phage/plasmid primase, P4 family [Streptomyces sp. NBC_01764]
MMDLGEFLLGDDGTIYEKTAESLADDAQSTEVPEPSEGYRNSDLSEIHLGERIAREYLDGEFIAWGRSAWSRWDGRRWARCSDSAVFDAVRRAVLRLYVQEITAVNERHTQATADAAKLSETKEEEGKAALSAANTMRDRRVKELNALRFAGKVASLQRVARGVLEREQSEFDAHPDLLNVGNGVVDLKTGELRPHDPQLMFTKVTPVDYRPDAVHPDWEAALTALPAEVADWMQIRFGQAATGHATQDDVVPFLRGGGANGKSTMLDGITRALGEFSVMVPDKVLLASPSDHPTEMMTLFGARFAYIEELPEGDYLNAQRLKKAAGTDNMTARYIGQDNVTWDATHSLFVTTNYEVQVDAVDYGTWRRLALVMFPFTFDGSDPEHPKDPTLRKRILDGKEGQHEAVLAWLVDGAAVWYDNGEVIPPMPDSVKADTTKWRYDANHAAKFLDERYELDPDAAMRSTDVYSDFVEWAELRGIRKWGEKLFWTRARHHDWFVSGEVEKPDSSVRTKSYRVDVRTSPLKERERLVIGLRPIAD